MLSNNRLPDCSHTGRKAKKRASSLALAGELMGQIQGTKQEMGPTSVRNKSEDQLRALSKTRSSCTAIFCPQ